MVFSIAYAFSIIRAAQISGFFCLLATPKTDLVNECTGIKGHLVLIKIKPFSFKKTSEIKYFPFFP